MDLSADISLHIENDITPPERRKIDSKLVIESFNSQISKLEEVIKKEDLVEFIEDLQRKEKKQSFGLADKL